MKIAFVILHYKVASVTIECITNLLKQSYDNFQIIIVDNKSDNGSIEAIQEKFAKHEKLYFVFSERNVGFAKANDLGYQIAKHKFNADCIVIINNDLMIEDALFCDKVNSILKEQEYDIIGPDIINMKGDHQNPFLNCIIGKSAVSKQIFVNRIKIILVKMLYQFRKDKKEKTEKKSPPNLELTEGVPLHGSCLIFGNSFIKKHEYPFLPDTFLFAEEEILYYLSSKENLRIVFDPLLKVKHMEDVSTNNILINKKEKRLFELRNSSKSLEILKNLMKNDN